MIAGRIAHNQAVYGIGKVDIFGHATAGARACQVEFTAPRIANITDSALDAVLRDDELSRTVFTRPEMVGRLPVIATLSALDEKALIEILTKPKNALSKQYKRFFEMENAELEFTEGALHALAKKALKRDTGARALRAITEELMVDLMYKLPEEPKPAKYVITRDVVEGKANLFDQQQNAKKESA